MPPLPQVSPVVDMIYRWRERRVASNEQPRNRLGGSLIGHACDRHIWYKFRHAKPEVFDGRMLRLFNTGEREEDRLVEELEAIGVTVTDRQMSVGNGLIGGSIDGIGLGVPGAEKTRHLLEFKTHSAKFFANLWKEGIPDKHMAQMQFYMHLSGLTRALYLAVNKDTDELYGERVHYDAAMALRLMAKAERIAAMKEAPQRAYGKTHWECKWCPFYGMCHGNEMPERTCRTCNDCVVHHETDRCASDNKDNFPSCHRFIPALVPFDQVDYDENRDVIVYDGWEDDGRATW